jgi:glycosyltransferase involved in cell wall biosynthesis
VSNLPRITIITPSFNQGKYIEQTILSVLEQDYPNLEYIIMDGGSSDETVEIIRKYESQIAYWESKPDNGQSDAINKGLQRATGDVFNWLNSDDILEKGALQEVGKAFAEKDILSFNGVCRTFKDGNLAETVNTTYTTFSKSAEQTIAKPGMGQPSQFYSLNAIREIGNCVNSSLSHSMDMELWYRFLFRFGTDKVGFTNTTLSSFRLHGESKSVSLYEIFRKDDYALYLSIFNQFNAPDFLKNFVLKFELNKNYRNTWDTGVIKPELLFAWFAVRFATEYYTLGEYDNCRKCLLYARKNGYPVDSNFLSLLGKVMLLPIPLINFARKIKNR